MVVRVRVRFSTVEGGGLQLGYGTVRMRMRATVRDRSTVRGRVTVTVTIRGGVHKHEAKFV